MTNARTSKQIKLTDVDHSALVELATAQNQTLQTVLDGIVTEYIGAGKAGEEIDFLVPKLSCSHRSLWFTPAVISKVKEFAKANDVSQNAVIYTALKRRLNRCNACYC